MSTVLETRAIGLAYVVVVASYLSIGTKTEDPQSLRRYILYGVGYMFISAAFLLGRGTAIPKEHLREDLK